MKPSVLKCVTIGGGCVKKCPKFRHVIYERPTKYISAAIGIEVTFCMILKQHKPRITYPQEVWPPPKIEAIQPPPLKLDAVKVSLVMIKQHLINRRLLDVAIFVCHKTY